MHDGIQLISLTADTILSGMYCTDGIVFVNVDATAGNVNVTLDSPSDARDTVFYVKKTDASANTVTVTGTIDGAASKVLAIQYDTVCLIADKTTYHSISPDLTQYPDGSGTADYLARWTDSDTLGIGATRDNGSAVAIGAAPDANALFGLHANNSTYDGTAPDLLNMLIKNVGLGDAGLLLDVGNGTQKWAIFIDNSDSDRLKIYNVTNSGNVFNLAPNGWIGVNINNPSQNLHVRGAQWAFSPACGVLIESITSGGVNSAPALQFAAPNFIAGTSRAAAVGMATSTYHWSEQSLAGDLVLRPLDEDDRILFAFRNEPGTGGSNSRAGIFFLSSSVTDHRVGFNIQSPGNTIHTYANDSTNVLETADKQQILIEQDGAGDSGIGFELTGGQRYSIGIDNSDSDKFKLRDITNSRDSISVSTAGVVSTSGKVNVDDTTDATSTTDGSLQTDGGLSVAKRGVFGDDISVLADSKNVELGAGGDMVIYYDGTEGNIDLDLVTASDLVIDCGTNKTLVLEVPGWDDLNFDPDRSGGPAATRPDDVTINNVVHKEFTSSNNQLCGAVEEVPHKAKLSETLYPHIHLFLKNSESAGTTGVTFTFYWELRQASGVTSGSVELAATSAQLTANPVKFDIYDSTGFTGPISLGAQLAVTIARTAGDAGDVVVLTYGIHYKIDTPAGSRQLSVK